MKKSIILTGGGTAGHIMPNLALLPALQKEFDKIYYLGSNNSMEQKILHDYNYVEFISIPTTKLVRKFTLKNLGIPFKLINSICKTKKIIKKISPDVIFCKGGFVSVPVAIAGKLCKVPVIAHESDLSMGLANKIILRFANKMCVSFKDTARISKKCITTGTPLRKQIFEGNAQNIKSKFCTQANKPYVLFFGGSLGSKFINNLVKESLPELIEEYNILHITGKGNRLGAPQSKTDRSRACISPRETASGASGLACKPKDASLVSRGYYQVEFTNNIEDFFACADIVVCRGGANSLFELLALKKPMLIIPLSKAESRGDQLENAEYFKKNHQAQVLQESEATPKTLLQTLNKIMTNKHQIISAMNASQTSANEKIVKTICSCIK